MFTSFFFSCHMTQGTRSTATPTDQKTKMDWRLILISSSNLCTYCIYFLYSVECSKYADMFRKMYMLTCEVERHFLSLCLCRPSWPLGGALHQRAKVYRGSSNAFLGCMIWKTTTGTFIFVSQIMITRFLNKIKTHQSKVAVKRETNRLHSIDFYLGLLQFQQQHSKYS